MEGLNNIREAYEQVYAQIDEAEGSYGQTPKARQAFGDLANKRRETPASGFAKRGEKTQKVKSASKHFDRTLNPDAGNRGKKSTKPSTYSGKRSGMTQSDRDYSRGEAEYGHTGYDPDWNGPASGPGGKPKGKKLARQKARGVSAENYNFYDLYMSVYEAMSDDEKEMRRLAAAERRAGKSDRMDSKVAAKYAGSEAQSAARADKKSKGKHIHGMADSYDVEGDLVDEARKPSQIAKIKKLNALMNQRHQENEKARKEMIGTQAHKDMVKAASKHFEEVELSERELDPTETREKERLVKGLKKSAGDFKKRYGTRAKSVMYATATKMAKDRMDTSKSDRRYGVEG